MYLINSHIAFLSKNHMAVGGVSVLLRMLQSKLY